MTTTFDAVVVGSGAGGAPVACRLCEAGWRVLLIERGKAYQRTDFDRDEIEWCRRDRFVPSPRTDPHTRRSDEGQRAGLTTDGWISTVLGGGTGALSAAWGLTSLPNWRDDYDITVYQMGWRLGGKGASGRAHITELDICELSPDEGRDPHNTLEIQ